MRKLLVPVDGRNAARLKSAVAEAIAIYRKETVEVHLLNVQTAVSSHVAMFFHGSELQQIQHDAGMEELAPARALLDGAKVPYMAKVVVGRGAESIARVAHDIGCDRIVMGREGPSFAGKIFGSLAGQVRQIMGGAGDCQVLGS